MKQPPKIIQDVGFDFQWDYRKVWKLDELVVEMDIDELTWHFDIPFWDSSPEIDDWDLTPWEFMEHIEKYPDHHRVMMQADEKYPIEVMMQADEEYPIEVMMQADEEYPIEVMMNKGRWLLPDGLHRLVKQYMSGAKTVKVRKIPRSRIADIVSDS